MTATAPASTDLRDCRLYRFYGWDPRTNYTTKTLIYIGETVREPFDRLMEHVGRKPWADTITSWEVDDRVFAGKDQVLAAEQAAVEAEKPLYNDEWNHGNSDRVELSDQERQRWARDTAAGKTPWRRPQRRPMYRQGLAVDAPGTHQSTPIVPNRRVSVPRKWTAVQVNPVIGSCTWVLIAVATWGALDSWGVFAVWEHRVICGLVASPLLLLWTLQRELDSVALWKRRMRKACSSVGKVAKGVVKWWTR
jgi:hypothetical protein